MNYCPLSIFLFLFINLLFTNRGQKRLSQLDEIIFFFFWLEIKSARPLKHASVPSSVWAPPLSLSLSLPTAHIRTPTPTPNTLRGRKPEVTDKRKQKKTHIWEAQQRDKSETGTITQGERRQHREHWRKLSGERHVCVCVCICMLRQA